MVEKIKRSLSLPIHLSALILTIVVFIIGIAVGNFLAGQVDQSFYEDIDALQANTVNLEFLSLLESDPTIRANPSLRREMCNAVEDSAHNLGVQTAEVGRRLRLFEQKRGEGQDVLDLQQRYFALEARDYLFWKKLKTLCSTNLTLVLYFYTMQCSECASFDAALTDFKKLNPPGILIYSFNLDYGDNSPPVALLSAINQVQNAPAIVVNDEKLTKQPSVAELQKLS